MATRLGKPYSLDWRGDPPHMLKTDVPVWYRFLEKYSYPFQNLYYDSLLGMAQLTPDELADPLKRDWQILTAKRTDAIAELPDQVWIIEVAEEPGLRALGQVLTYQALWIRGPAIRKPEKMVLVAARMDPNLLDACGMHSMLVFIV